MTQICSSSFLHNLGHNGLVHFQPDFPFSNFLMPTDFEDPSKANIFESKYTFLQLLVEFPTFNGVNQYRQHIAVEQAQF